MRTFFGQNFAGDNRLRRNIKEGADVDLRSSHFNFMLASLFHYGFIDRIVIEGRKQLKDLAEPLVITVDYEGTEVPFEFVSSEEFKGRELEDCRRVYFYHAPPDPAKVRDKKGLIIVNPQRDGQPRCPELGPKRYIPGLCAPRLLKPLPGLMAMVEGECQKGYVSKRIPTVVHPLLQWEFTKFHPWATARPEVRYDWLMLGSLQRIKRTVDFVEMLVREGLTHYKGVIVSKRAEHFAEGSDKRREIEEEHARLRKLQEHIDVEVMFGLNVPQKREVALQSRMAVCCSVTDPGPRALTEVMQLELPVLSMPHIGTASSFVRHGVNGLLAKRFKDLGPAFRTLMEDIDSFDTSINRDLLDPDRIYPRFVEKLTEIESQLCV